MSNAKPQGNKSETMVKNRGATAQRTRGDEMGYCARCGVSFVWTVEEQNRAQEGTEGAGEMPSHCPGCRHLLPISSRERGLVKWYNARKRFGFILRASGEELFAHGSALKGVRNLQPGELVEFGVQMTDKGAAAQEVVLLQRVDAADTKEGNG